MNLDMINQTNDLIRASIYQPLIRLITLEQSLGLRYPLYGKCENQQVTESFKNPRRSRSPAQASHARGQSSSFRSILRQFCFKLSPLLQAKLRFVHKL